ncbi:NAD(P)H-binding protein [Nocardia sp. NPDC050412]|uniref:NAD(P)H-binding protein n=1 Tax=Nocardia sp. NPDC050412 TaxID=3364320 RepID=UPI003790BA19
MRVFVAGGTGHSGSYIIPELVAAGHEVTALARSDTAAAAVSTLGAKVHLGDLQDLDGLKEAAADSDGVIHVAHRQDLLPSGGIDAVAAAELPIMLAYGEALAGTGKPLVAAGSIGSPGNLGRPPRTTRPFPSATSTGAPCGPVTSWRPPWSASPSGECGHRSCGLPTSHTAPPIIPASSRS